MRTRLISNKYLFSFNKHDNWFATLTVGILKTKLLAGNDHVIDIFTSEDVENISLCIFSILLSTIYNKIKYLSPREALFIINSYLRTRVVRI